MRAEQKSNVKNSIGRLMFVGLAVVLQVVWIVLMFIRLNRYSNAIHMFFSIVATIVVLRIYVKSENTAFKLPWIILILAAPGAGIVYLRTLRTQRSQQRDADTL